MPRILFVFSSHEDLGTTGKKTGWYLPEVAHPYYIFKDAGFEIDMCSPKGGKSLMDEGSGETFKEDPTCSRLSADSEVLTAIENTKPASEVDGSKYDVIFFPGGHAPMYDLPDNEVTNKLAAQVYENGGIVCAVCHGVVGIVNTKLSNGEYMIKGHKVTSFTNLEEEQVELMAQMPFPLQTRLAEHGAEFVEATPWSANIATSNCGRIITGQNPQSANGMAEAVIKAVKK